MKDYLKNLIRPATTPQSKPLPNSTQVKNSAGGYSWQVSRWERLNRFLILGSEGGSYYASEHNLTVDNAANVLDCIQADGKRVVATTVDISQGGRAAKNDPAIFVLALAASVGDDATRKLALDSIPQVCRTGTHLFSFAEYIKGMRGWGRGLRRGVADWYLTMDERRLAYQIVKYRQRNGWTHTDTLRLAHPKPKTTVQDKLFQWITRPDEATWATADTDAESDALAFVQAFERVQAAETLDEVLRLIATYDLPREALPTQWLKDAAIWEALLDKMPMWAMIRNLGNMSKCGLLVAGSDAAQTVVARLTDAERLRQARVHPISVLSALMVYKGGRALRGGYRASGSTQDWQPVPTVIDALDTAFDLAFEHIEPTRQRTMLALDVSGSMSGGMVSGVAGLSPRMGAAAMAMVTARTEPRYTFTAFSDQIMPLDISAKMRLDTVIQRTSNLPFSRTDCALPMLYAQERKLKIDAFVVYTDNETWFGKVHPAVALQQYRQATGIAAKLIVVGMVGNRFTIADPDDKGMLDVVGFDTTAPRVMADFVRGDI